VIIVLAVVVEFLVEELDVAELSRSSARVELPRPERYPIVQVEGERRIV
jgi:hypothetical protein